MTNYETIYIAHPDATEAVIGEINKKIVEVLKKHDGKVTKVEDWGTRRLSYHIKKQMRGHYVHTLYSAKPGATKEIERTLTLREDVLKQLTIKLEEEGK